jgi:Aldo/keto reductase family
VQRNFCRDRKTGPRTAPGKNEPGKKITYGNRSRCLGDDELACRWGAGENRGEISRRKLGRTGEEVSLIGLGGFHLGRSELTETDAIRIIRSGMGNGINLLDNCWDYNGGESEVRMGKALRDGYCQKAFLMTNIDGRE